MGGKLITSIKSPSDRTKKNFRLREKHYFRYDIPVRKSIRRRANYRHGVQEEGPGWTSHRGDYRTV
jgi:phage gp29-like protein